MRCSQNKGTRPFPGITHTVVASLIVFILASCAAPRTAATVEANLIEHYERWKGTPYRLGGDSRDGVDCSAFVQVVMLDALGVRMPRTTREQLGFGRRVALRSTRPGDLVFFRTGRTTYHVGIMLRGDFFMHASTSRGVTIDRLSDAYWSTHMIDIRRPPL